MSDIIMGGKRKTRKKGRDKGGWWFVADGFDWHAGYARKGQSRTLGDMPRTQGELLQSNPS